MSASSSNGTPGALSTILVRNFPDAYFRNQQEERTMKAPFRALQVSYYAELSVLLGIAAFFIQYFFSQGVPTVTISNTLIDGQLCQVLSPRRDVVYFSKEHSENAQFASPYLNFSECVSYVSASKICEDGNRNDHMSLLGVKNPNISIFVDTGYVAFSPTTIVGLSTTLDVFFQQSASFPRPDMTRPFYGDDKNWYIYSYKKGEFSQYPGTPISTLIHDRATNKVYFPAAGKKDFDFSYSQNFSVSDDSIYQIGENIGSFAVVIIAIYDGTVFALRTAGRFKNPLSVAVDTNGDAVLADTGNSKIRKVDHATGYVENLLELNLQNGDKLYGVAVSQADNSIVYYSTVEQVWKLDTTTGTSTELGLNSTSSVEFGEMLWLAVDGSENLIIADEKKDIVWRMNATTDVAEDIGAAADPPFNAPKGVSVDSQGAIYVADFGNHDIRVIHVNGSVSGQPSKGTPMLTAPVSVTVSTEGIIYFLNWEYNYVVMIDVSGHLSILGQSATPAWSVEINAGIAVDADGSVFVTSLDALRKISSSLGDTTNMGTFAEPEYFTVNQEGEVSSFVKLNIGYVDAVGTCQKIEQDPSNQNCNVVSTRNLDAEKQTVYFELIKYVKGVPNFCHDLFSFSFVDLTVNQTGFPQVCAMKKITEPFVYAVIDNPTVGVRVFTTAGFWQPSYGISEGGMNSNLYGTPFDKLILDGETTVIKVTVVPDFTLRYLIIALKQLGLYVNARFDTFTDTYEYIIIPFATPTHFMITYTWGVCNGKVMSELVELSGTTSFANSCTEPNGLYYQAPNYYYPIPYNCLGISYDKLLTDCEEIASNMKTLVSDTCESSIPKVCSTQYNSNPPFTCSVMVYPSALTVLSLSISNTLALAGVFSAITALILKFIYKQYQPTETEIALTNDDREFGDLLRETFSFSKSEEGKAEPNKGDRGDKALQDENNIKLQYEQEDDETGQPDTSADPSGRASRAGSFSSSSSYSSSSSDAIVVSRFNSHSSINQQDAEPGILIPSLFISQTLRSLDYVNPTHLIWSSGSPRVDDNSLRATEIALAEKRKKAKAEL